MPLISSCLIPKNTNKSFHATFALDLTFTEYSSQRNHSYEAKGSLKLVTEIKLDL